MYERKKDHLRVHVYPSKTDSWGEREINIQKGEI